MLAMALGTDAFSVAVCVGLAGATTKQKVRLAAGFGAFQFLMPITGLAVGSQFGKIAGSVAGYVGGAIIVGLGIAMIWRTLSKGFHCPPFIHKSFIALIVASVGVSIDALAVGIGVGLGDRDLNIVPASVVIGIITFLMTVVGVEVGGKVGEALQHRAPIVGGAVLIVLGVLIAFG